jgi:hypothetical protein
MIAKIKRLYHYYAQAHHVPRSPLAVVRMVEFAVLLAGEDRATDAEFLREAQTGDIVVMVSDCFYSWVQTFWTSSYASHVGVCFRDERGRLFIYESTHQEKGIVDEVTGREKDGPMLIDAETRLRHYLEHDGFSFRWRRLRLPPGLSADALVRPMRKFMNLHKFDAFDANPARLIQGASATWLPGASWLGFDRPDPHRIFCSRLVAQLYISLGLLRPERPASEYSPSDWTSQRHNLALQDGVGLSGEHVVYYY